MAFKTRALFSRRLRALLHGEQAPTGSSRSELCALCGEETALGSVFYADRHTIEHEDGRRTYLCTLCNEHVRSSRRGQPLTDDELRDPDANGVLAAITLIRGPMPGPY
jgi:hypothetical protein